MDAPRCFYSCSQTVSCTINFSLLVQRKVAKEKTLRRGRFRILPLLRTTLIETAKGDLRIPRWIPLGADGTLFVLMPGCGEKRYDSCTGAVRCSDDRDAEPQSCTKVHRVGALFFWPGRPKGLASRRGPSSFRQGEKKMGGALRRLSPVNTQISGD